MAEAAAAAASAEAAVAAAAAAAEAGGGDQRQPTCGTHTQLHKLCFAHGGFVVEPQFE